MNEHVRQNLFIQKQFEKRHNYNDYLRFKIRVSWLQLNLILA